MSVLLEYGFPTRGNSPFAGSFARFKCRLYNRLFDSRVFLADANARRREYGL